MRTAINHGPCAQCGDTKPGLYWESRQHILDFGDGSPPRETFDGKPILCDKCELISRYAPLESEHAKE